MFRLFDRKEFIGCSNQHFHSRFQISYITILKHLPNRTRTSYKSYFTLMRVTLRLRIGYLENSSVS